MCDDESVSGLPQHGTPQRTRGLSATKENMMELGAFSVSLAVKDIAASRTFYEKLGFSVFGGKQEDNWLIMKSGTTLIGLFQGMFEKNMLTFNPGWDADAKPIPGYMDVRTIQKLLKEQQVELGLEADVSTTGPAFITLTDPDGNPILIDQHI